MGTHFKVNLPFYSNIVLIFSQISNISYKNNFLFSGLDKLTSEFSSWEWIYGKTPSFTVNRLLKFPRSDVTESDLLNLTLQVEKGIIEDIKMSLPSDITNETSNREASVISNLRGTRYHHKVIEKIIAALGCIAILPAHAQKIDNIALQ